MNEFEVIIRPLVTEKGNRLAELTNAYSFEVDPKSNKQQIREAVEKIYKVKVAGVRTMNRRGKPYRAGHKYDVRGTWKKAVVKLQADYRIDVFG
jgi:large subunit ribosomal protein L23